MRLASAREDAASEEGYAGQESPLKCLKLALFAKELVHHLEGRAPRVQGTTKVLFLRGEREGGFGVLVEEEMRTDNKRKEEGSALTEFALLIALVAVVTTASAATLGQKVSTKFSSVASATQENGGDHTTGTGPVTDGDSN